MLKIVLKAFIMLALSAFSLSSFAGEAASGERARLLSGETGPDTADYALTYNGVAVVVLLQLFNGDIAPKEPVFTAPNGFDASIRRGLRWPTEYLGAASTTSDIILGAVFLSSVFWSPFLTDNDYQVHNEVILEAFVLTSLITNIVKFSVARQRPYAYYGTRDSEGGKDNLSFFSGHSSTAFAIATSTAYLLSKANPNYSVYYWASSLTLAAFVGYLRIAADKHYFTDVIVGSAVGAAVGYFVTKERFNRWGVYASGEKIIFSINIPL